MAAAAALVAACTSAPSPSVSTRPTEPVASDAASLGPEETPASRQQSFGPNFVADVPTGPFQSINAGGYLSADRRVLTVGFIGGRAYSRTDWCAVDYAAWASIRGNALLVAVTTIEHPDQASMPPNGACTMEGYDYVFRIALPAPFRGDVVRDLGSDELWIPPPERVAEPRSLPAGMILGGLRVAEGSEPQSHDFSRSYYIPPGVPGGPNPSLALRQVLGAPPEPGAGSLMATAEVWGQPAEVRNAGGPDGLSVTWELDGDGFTLIGYDMGLSIDAFVEMANAFSLPGR